MAGKILLRGKSKMAIEISQYPGRIFYFNFPERFTNQKTKEGYPVEPIPARSLAVVVFPPGVPDAPPKVPKRDGYYDRWNGWSPQCKPGIEAPWDGKTWGQAPSVLYESFYPFSPVMFGKAYPLCKNELFPIIKKTRDLFVRDFYGFLLFHRVTITDGKINYTPVSQNEANDSYRLIGDFADGFEGYPVIDIQGTAL
jgi:hypothetical protein